MFQTGDLTLPPVPSRPVAHPSGTVSPGHPPALPTPSAPAPAAAPPPLGSGLTLSEPEAADLDERTARELMRHFRGWTCWLGRRTGQWWALSPNDVQERLLSADSPRELGQRIKEAARTLVPDIP